MKGTQIGNNIRIVREAKGITQEGLAKKLKLRKRTIAKIEKTENLSMSAIGRIAHALGTTVEEILNPERTND